jgi:hypothetical protein
MPTPAADRPFRVPDHVMVRKLAGEAVLLNLDSEMYYGLDDVGLRMWTLLTTLPTRDAVLTALQREYGVPRDTLRHDLEALVTDLLAHGLLTCDGAD